MMSLFSKKETVSLGVQGMHCEHCVASVKSALEGVEGVTSANVSLEDSSAVVEGHGFATDALLAAIEGAGFTANVAA